MGRDDLPEWAVPGMSPDHGPLPRAGERLVDETVRLTERFAERARSDDVGGQLVLARQLIDQLESVWMLAAADYETRGGVADAGSGSLGAWMRHHCRMAPGEASTRSRVAHAVTSGELPRTGDALVEGAVTWRHAQVIQNSVRLVPQERRDEAEQAMLTAASTLDPGALRQVGDRLLHCFNRELAEEAAVRRYERRGVTMCETIDGLYALSGLLDPITGALVMTALDARMRPPASDSGDGHASDGTGGAGADGHPAPDLRTWPQRRADALGEICSEWLEAANQGIVGGVRPHLSVIVDVSTLRASTEDAGDQAVIPGELAWAGTVTASETQLIGCDATISRVLMDGPSMVLDVGRATRTIPPAIRRAVVARDRMCVAPGCYRPPEHCDVHHVVFWEQGGSTSLDNLALVCRRHHRMVHQMSWQVTIDASGRRSLQPPR